MNFAEWLRDTMAVLSLLQKYPGGLQGVLTQSEWGHVRNIWKEILAGLGEMTSSKLVYLLV